MQILKKNLKDGVVEVRVHTLDDLWHLQKLLEPGNLVTTKTRRKTAIKRGQDIEEGDRKPMILTLAVEKVEFRKSLGSMRITGPIKAGPSDVQLSSYHTVSIKPGSEVKIEKESWKPHQIKELEQAKTKKAMVFICLIDRDQANFAELRESGVETLGTVKARKFAEDEPRDEYYQKVLEYIEKKKDFQHIIVAGPGFERENLHDYIKVKNRALAEKILLHHTSSVGGSGINEVLKTPVDRIVKDSRVARETQYVEELFKRIKTEGLAAYGPEETARAVDIGAVETLLVSDEKTQEFEEIMNKTEKSKGEVVIISSEHESGEGFLHLGGIAALLRFRF
jgi:protein pelota